MKIYILILIIFFTSCIKDVNGVVDITIVELKEVIERENEIQLLDVRLSSETNKGMILNAIHVNLLSNDFESKVIDVLDKEKPVYVYCRSGSRSKIASKVLLDKGYEVFNVKGGYKDWLKEKVNQ